MQPDSSLAACHALHLGTWARLTAPPCASPVQAKAQSITLSSFEPPLAKQFALRQLQLMIKEQLPQEAAFARVEQDMKPQLLALTR